MRTRMLAATLVLLLGASTSWADTRIGNANMNTVQSWSFTPTGTGQVQVVLNWTNNSARLTVIVVCGTSDPLVFGIAGGNVNRLAMLQFGAVPGVQCLAGVSSLRGSSAYRIHFLRDVNQPSQGRGRAPLALDINEAMPGSILAYTVERELDRLRQLSNAF